MTDPAPPEPQQISPEALDSAMKTLLQGLDLQKIKEEAGEDPNVLLIHQRLDAIEKNVAQANNLLTQIAHAWNAAAEKLDIMNTNLMGLRGN